MLLKWIFALVLPGSLLIAPAGFADQTDQQSLTPVVKQTPGQLQQLASASLSLLDSGFYSMYDLDFAGAQ